MSNAPPIACSETYCKSDLLSFMSLKATIIADRVVISQAINSGIVSCAMIIKNCTLLCKDNSAMLACQ